MDKLINRYLIFIIVGILSLLIIVFDSGEISLFPFSLLLIAIGMFFFRKKSTERKLFICSFSIFLLFAIIYTKSYINVSGLPFIPGGDAENYYKIVIQVLNGNTTRYYGRFKLYYTINVFLYKFINVFINSNSHWFFIFFNMFFCSFIAPLLYKIGVLFFERKVVLKACFLTMLFPLIIQVATNTWREAAVYAPFLFSIYISVKNLSLKNIILFVLTVLIIANIRLEIALVALLFFVMYNFIFTLKNITRRSYLTKSNKIIIILILLISLGYLFNAGYFTYFQYESSSSFSQQIEAYNEHSEQTSAADSISTFLRQMGVIGYPFLFLFALLVPIPPPVLGGNGFALFNIIISLAAILWYFMLPIGLYTLYEFRKTIFLSRFLKSIIICSFIGLFVISLTSLGSPRHKLYLYPLFFLIFFWGHQRLDRNKKRKILTLTSFVYSMIFVAYILYKY